MFLCPGTATGPGTPPHVHGNRIQRTRANDQEMFTDSVIVRPLTPTPGPGLLGAHSPGVQPRVQPHAAAPSILAGKATERAMGSGSASNGDYRYPLAVR